MNPAYVNGLSLWTPGHASLHAWLEESYDDKVVQPQYTFANSRLLRGTSLLTRMLIEVADAAGRDANIDSSTTPSVFASAFGEIQIAIVQMDMWRNGDGRVSPHRFKNSVHNTGAGVFSIASKNYGFTTAIAGGYQTVAMALLEAAGHLADGARNVILAIGEEPLPPPLDQQHKYQALGVGLVLSAQPHSDTTPLIRDLRPSDAYDPLPLSDPFRHNPCGAALELAERLYRHQAGTLRLTAEGHEHWSISIA